MNETQRSFSPPENTQKRWEKKGREINGNLCARTEYLGNIAADVLQR